MNTDPRALSVSEECINRLFFAAKNLAIECGMRRIEDFLRDRGFPNASVRWMEDSLSARIDITVPMKRRKHPVKWSVYLKRHALDNDLRPRGLPRMEYEVETLSSGGRSPSSSGPMEALRGDGQEFVRTVVKGCNYPFAYSSASPF